MPPSDAIIWNVDPMFFQIGPLAIRYYGILFALSFLIGYSIIRSVFRREGKPESDLGALLMYMMVGTIAGARLGHCLFYNPEYYLNNPHEMLMVWEGGLASHGGAIGILTALFVYARRHPDRVVIVVALAGVLIRLGNFFNSEILGIPTDLPWAVIFDRIDDTPRHPAQLYESIAYGTIFMGLYRFYTRLEARTPRGFLFGLFLVSVFGVRFLIEFVKERQAADGVDLALGVGQILSIPLLILGIVFLVRALWNGFSEPLWPDRRP